MDVKIFGERNTASFALKHVVVNNSRSRNLPGTMMDIAPWRDKMVKLLKIARLPNTTVESAIDGAFTRVRDLHTWKHAATNFGDVSDFAGSCVLITVRHPLSWALSLYKNPYHALSPLPTTFAEFLETPWKTVARERLGQESFLPLALYEAKLRHYKDFLDALDAKGIPGRAVKFEDIVCRQEDVFEQIRPFLTEPAEAFSRLNTSTKSSSKNLAYYLDYYGNEKWKDEIDDDIVANFHFNQELLAFFGY